MCVCVCVCVFVCVCVCCVGGCVCVSVCVYVCIQINIAIDTYVYAHKRPKTHTNKQIELLS